jgi:hypothetical protein
MTYNNQGERQEMEYTISRKTEREREKHDISEIFLKLKRAKNNNDSETSSVSVVLR